MGASPKAQKGHKGRRTLAKPKKRSIKARPLEADKAAPPVFEGRDWVGASFPMIRLDSVLDLLSEAIVLEQEAASLYALARDRTEHADLRLFLSDTLGRCEEHSLRIQAMIRELGGDPAYVSPAAAIQRERIACLRGVNTFNHYQEISDIENILTVELQEKTIWSFLKVLVPYLEEPSVIKKLSRFVTESEQEEAKHVEWIQDILKRLLLQRAMQLSEPAQAA